MIDAWTLVFIFFIIAVIIVAAVLYLERHI